jgi:hypothetical protein
LLTDPEHRSGDDQHYQYENSTGIDEAVLAVWFGMIGHGSPFIVVMGGSPRQLRPGNPAPQGKRPHLLFLVLFVQALYKNITFAHKP